eukprot:gb/GFBE01018809.1/.p1 GENE.gb/GFBE01018809.1/~~gb/GFBE01018809.1/.p1  ORF type:complete len:266 (+),score=64.65 gb/GFBE01018809.1/:1-798(+)
MAVLKLAAALVVSAAAQDLFLAANHRETAVVLTDSPKSQAYSPAERQCAPLNWIKQDFGTGHWILNYSDATWGAYMVFLGVDKKHWNDEFKASDIHQYAFIDDYFIMNHTIPLTNFHLLYKASLSGKWEKNPYPQVTPAGMDPHAAVNLSNFRNVFEEPGAPHPDSCWAMRTDMPVVQNKSGVLKEYIVSFWRELTSPIDMRCTLHVKDAKTGEVIEPWATQMKDSKPFPNYSYRYFRKTVQSFVDAAKRLPCAPTGEQNGTYFC